MPWVGVWTPKAPLARAQEEVREPIIGNRGKRALPPQGKKLSKMRNLDIQLSRFPGDTLDV